jgi:hypothetical protein
MKKNRIFPLILAGVMFSGMMMTQSCKDDDNTSDAQRDPDAIAADPYEKSGESGALLYSILSMVSEIDSLPDNWKDATFEPTIGTVLDEADPLTRSVAVADLNEAIAKFNAMTLQNLPADTKEKRIDIEGVGALLYTAEESSDCIASIQFEIKQLPRLQTLNLVSADKIKNSSNGNFKGDPYYNIGDVVKDNDNCYWICIRCASSEDSKETSHWVSFQMASDNSNIETYDAAKGKQKAIVPKTMGTDEDLHLVTLLLAALNDTVGYKNYAANFNAAAGPFGINRKYSTPDFIREVARLWEENKIWDKVLPKNINKDYFSSAQNPNGINLFYNTSKSKSLLSGNPIETYLIEADGVLFSSHRTATQLIDRTTGTFDITEYIDNGKKVTLSNIGPDKALVVRTKTSIKLAGNWTTEPDPTKAIAKVSDVFNYNQKKAKIITAPYFKAGDIIEEEISNTDKIRWICIAPSQAGTIDNSTRKATFITFEGVTKNGKQANNVYNATNNEKKLGIQLYQFAAWYEATLKAYKTNENDVKTHYENAGIEIPSLFISRDSSITIQTNNTQVSSKSTSYFCEMAFYQNGVEGQSVARLYIDNLNNGTEAGSEKKRFYCIDTEYEDKQPMFLNDIAVEDKVNKYGKVDKWVMQPQEGQNNHHAPRTAKSDYNIDQYLYTNYTATYTPSKESMFNEPVHFFRTMELIDYGYMVNYAPNGHKLTMKKSSTASWYTDYTSTLYGIHDESAVKRYVKLNRNLIDVTKADFQN